MGFFSPLRGRLLICAAFVGCVCSSLPAADPHERTTEELAERIFAGAVRYTKPKLTLERELELVDLNLFNLQISADARRAAVTGRTNHLTMWDISGEPQKLWDLEPTLLRRGSKLAISRDGSQVAHGTTKGDVEVYDGATGERLHTHKALTAAIIRVGFSFDGKRLFAIDKFGNSFVAKPTEDGEVHSIPGLAPGENPKNMNMEVAGDKFWWKFMQIGDETRHWFCDGDKFLNPIVIELPRIIGQSAGPNQYFVHNFNEFAVLTPRPKEDGRTDLTVAYQKARFATGGVTFTSSGDWFWMRGSHVLFICRASDGRPTGLTDLPEELQNKYFDCYPDANCIILRTDRGCQIWKLAGNPVQPQMAVGDEIENLLAQQRFDVIEALAQKWNGRTEFFFDKENETPTTFMMDRLQLHMLPGETEEARNARYLKWIEENPENCQFMRIALFRIFYWAGNRVRGDGPAASVPEEAWPVFYRNLAQAWKVISPIFAEEQVPAEAYVCAIITGRCMNWPQEEVDVYLDKAYQQYPHYFRIYTAEAYARLPRWGGASRDAAAFARIVANKVGGDEGDVLYAQIGRRLAQYVGWKGLVDEVGLSPDRYMRGMLILSERAPDQLQWNQTLLYAAMINDADSIRKICERFVAVNKHPILDLWPGKNELIDKIYDETRGVSLEKERAAVQEKQRLFLEKLAAEKAERERKDAERKAKQPQKPQP